MQPLTFVNLFSSSPSSPYTSPSIIAILSICKSIHLPPFPSSHHLIHPSIYPLSIIYHSTPIHHLKTSILLKIRYLRISHPIPSPSQSPSYLVHARKSLEPKFIHCSAQSHLGIINSNSYHPDQVLNPSGSIP
ncbi:hypothetical protein EYC84_012075 [Monilinia fructicola]|uniref:Uncharacterized protein n=1 Tax=Monilinia fructicola TaxID=38448 RepID=A0A5M9J873_MONFR|nr:hypothetical protein EYC84_012075 [Monilinia fructicola]